MSEFPKTVTMEVFRGGKQTDKSGNTKTWTEADLDKIISATQKVGEDVPATVGHPEDNSPAVGWYGKSKIFRKGLTLFAELGNVHKKFAQALRDKSFKNRSLSLRKDSSIRHISFLGGKMPAIKGLAGFSFDEGDEEFDEFEFEFGEGNFTDRPSLFSFHTIGRVFQNLRDMIVSDKSIEVADKAIPQFEIDALKEMHNSGHEENDRPSFQEPDLNKQGHAPNNGGDDMDIKDLEAKFDNLNNKFSELEKTNTSLTTDLKTSNEAKDKSEKDFTEHKEKEIKNKFSEWVDGMANQKEGAKILPKNKNAIVETLGMLHGQESQEFSEGDETKKFTPVDIVKSLIENGPTLIEFGEKFNDGKNRTTKDDSGDEMMKLIREREKEAGISFNEANQQIMDENHNLVQKL